MKSLAQMIIWWPGTDEHLETWPRYATAVNRPKRHHKQHLYMCGSGLPIPLAVPWTELCSYAWDFHIRLWVIMEHLLLLKKSNALSVRMAYNTAPLCHFIIALRMSSLYHLILRHAAVDLLSWLLCWGCHSVSLLCWRHCLACMFHWGHHPVCQLCCGSYVVSQPQRGCVSVPCSYILPSVCSSAWDNAYLTAHVRSISMWTVTVHYYNRIKMCL